MEIFAFGPLLMLLLSGGGGSDLLTLLNAEDYFRTRGIETRVEKMMELASRAPADSKASVQQLLALRVLGEQADKLKASKEFAEYREILTQIAAGKKAQDNLGFAREYALWTLSRAGVTVAADQAPPVRKLQESALEWFPNKLTLAAALEIHWGRSFDPGDNQVRKLFDALGKLIPPDSKDRLYKTVEQLGNVRVDRAALGYLADPNDSEKGQIYIRLTGKGDRRQLVELLSLGMAVKDIKGNDKEPPIAILHGSNSPAFAVIGDHDFIIAGNLEGKFHLDAVEQVLAVRAGKEASVLKGPLADDLKKISEKAAGFVVGTLPEPLLKNLTMPQGPFKAVPAHFVLEAQLQGDKLALRLQGQLKNVDDAKSFCDTIVQLRAKGLEALTKLPNPPENPPFPFDAAEAKAILTSIQVEAKGDTATVSMQVSRNAVASIFTRYLSARDRASEEAGKAQQPPPP